MGGSTIVYVVYGGNKSVIWADVVQMAIIWLGIFVCFGVAIAQLPAEVRLLDALALGQAAGRLRTIDTSVALARLQQRAPAEAAALRGRHDQAVERRETALALARARQKGADTAEATRAYLEGGREVEAVRSEAAARMSALDGARFNDTNYIFPSYILSQLPVGLAGLVIAVIFAAAMSTLSGEFNSLASASMVDFVKRFGLLRSEAYRLLTALWGIFACVIALRAGQLGSAIEVVNRFGSYFYGSILGVFGLAVLTPRAAARGAFYGLMAGMAAVALVARYTAVHFLWYNVVGAATVFLVGLAISLRARP